MTVTTTSKRTTLLTPSEVTACKKLASSDLPDRQRASALLAIHQGNTQAQAAESAGLTLGQVKYIITRFRRLGMAALATVDNAAATQQPAKPKKAKKDKKKNKDVKQAKKDKSDKKKNKDKKSKDKKSKKDKKKKNKK